MTISDNKLIAIFMGGKTSDMNNKIVQGHQNIWLPIHGICNWTTVDIGNGKTLQYHNSWDWLMPVVEKIEKEFTVKIIRYSDEAANVCEIETTDQEPLQITYIFGYDYDGKTKINVVYDAVVEFIKWYNN